MPEGLLTAEGAPVAAPAIEPDFAALQVAQAAKADEEPEHAAPPKKDPDAPYGRRSDGSPKKGPGGRPAKAAAKLDQPRVASPTAAGAKKDFTEDLTGLVQTAWGTLAAFSPADAGAVKLSGPGLVASWNALAQENAQVARGIEWLTSGSVYGAVVMTTMPLVLQLMANHGRLDAERVAALGVQEPAKLAAMTAADVQAMAEAAQAAA